MLPKESLHILQDEIAVDPNSNKELLLKLNNNLYLYDKQMGGGGILLPFQLGLKSINKIPN